MDETWCHHFEPEGKRQSQQWKLLNSPPPKKSRAVYKRTGKIMMTYSFHCRGSLRVDVLQRGAMQDTLQKERHHIKSKPPGLCRTESSFCTITPVPILPIGLEVSIRDLAGKVFNILRTAQIFLHFWRPKERHSWTLVSFGRGSARVGEVVDPSATYLFLQDWN